MATEMYGAFLGLNVSVEWDEPGAGSVVINGKRVINFNVETDWSEPWNPHVDVVGLHLLDVLPRLVQERENAYDVARRYEADVNALRELLRRHTMDWGECDFLADCSCSHATVMRFLGEENDDD